MLAVLLTLAGTESLAGLKSIEIILRGGRRRRGSESNRFGTSESRAKPLSSKNAYRCRRGTTVEPINFAIKSTIANTPVRSPAVSSTIGVRLPANERMKVNPTDLVIRSVRFKLEETFQIQLAQHYAVNSIGALNQMRLVSSIRTTSQTWHLHEFRSPLPAP